MSDESTTIQELKDQVYTFSQERNWGQYHTPKNLVMSIMIEAAELAEHFQWQRTEEEVKAGLGLKGERQAVADELSDVFTYLLNLATVLDIDLSDAFYDKMSKTKEKFPADRWAADDDDKSIIIEYLTSRRDKPKNSRGNK